MRRPRGSRVPAHVPPLALRFLTPLYDASMRRLFPDRGEIDALLEATTISSAHSVLDVGAGTGALSRAVAAARPGVRVTGIEPDRDALRIAFDGARESALRVPVRGIGQQLPFVDGTFDRAISRLVFHHLGEQGSREVLHEIHRVLRPGGRLGILDWGKPRGVLRRATFASVRALDGFAATRVAARGGLPEIIAAVGFVDVAVVTSWNRLLGTIMLCTATRPPGGRQRDRHETGRLGGAGP